MRIKVLFSISTLERGGPTNIIYNIIKYLDRSKIIPIILTFSPEPLNSRKEDFENLNVQVYTYNRSRFHWVFSSMNDFRKMISDINPDIIHSHSLRADISSAKHLGSYISISTIHGDLLANYKNTYNLILAKIFSRNQIGSIKKMDFAVACSKAVYNTYKGEIRNLTFIQNGVDTETFYPVNNKNELRMRLSLPLDHILFISIGSLTQRKDPETVIKAFLDYKSNSASSLLILGSGDLEKTLRTKYGNDKHIIFKGFISHVNDYLQASDFYISASKSEGLPNTVLEALACGVPVCLSDIPSHQEVLEINSNGGALFRCGVAKELSDRLGDLIIRNSSQLQQAALSIVTEKLNARYMAMQYQNVYFKLIKEK